MTTDFWRRPLRGAMSGWGVRARALPATLALAAAAAVAVADAAAGRAPWAAGLLGGFCLLALYLHLAAAADLRDRLRQAIEASAAPAGAAVDAGRGEVGELLRALHGARGHLEGMARRVGSASGGVTSAGESMALAAQTLAIQTEEQTTVIRDSTQAVNDVLAAVRQTSDMAATVDAVSQRLCVQADASTAAVANIVEAMQRIQQKTARMSECVTTINGITFQTNILALNAAIEAARAGESGRGFMVVAGEVRALANHASQVSAEIGQIIAQADAEVTAGVKTVASVRGAIEDVTLGFREVSEQMRDVSGNNLSQSAAMEIISLGLERLTEITTTSNQLVVQSVGAAEELRANAQELDRLLEHLGAASGGAAPAASVPVGAGGAAQAVEFF